MLIEKIKSDELLKNHIKSECCENNVSVSISPNIDPKDYTIIKVDSFYNNLNLEKTPASIDCLIIQKCSNGNYSITLVELKCITSTSGFTLNNVKEKFNTCINDFMKIRFKEYFNRDYKKFHMYFVTNIDIYKRNLGLKLEILIQYRFDWRGKKYIIDPRMPIPEIRNC